MPSSDCSKQCHCTRNEIGRVYKLMDEDYQTTTWTTSGCTHDERCALTVTYPLDFDSTTNVWPSTLKNNIWVR